MELSSAPSATQLRELHFQSDLISQAIAEFETRLKNATLAACSGVKQLRSLVHFAKFHFACEEKILRSYEHPLLDVRLSAHEHMFQVVDATVQQIECASEIAHDLWARVLELLSRQLASEQSITHRLFSELNEQ